MIFFLPAVLFQYDEQGRDIRRRDAGDTAGLAEWALPYVRTGGYFISLKGAQYEEELEEGEKALQILGGKVAEVRPVRLPGLDDVRAVLYIEKVKESPKKYPRKPKMAAKNPL